MKRKIKKLLSVIFVILAFIAILLPACTKKTGPITTATTPVPATTASPTVPAVPTTIVPTIAIPTATTSQVPAKVVRVRVNGQMPVGNGADLMAKRFVENAEKASGGTLKFSYYPAQQFLQLTQLADAVPAGAIEMTFSDQVWFGGLTPEANLQDCMSLNEDEFYRWLWDAEAGGGITYTHHAKFLKFNLWRLVTAPYMGAWGGNAFTSGKSVKKPLLTAQDFKGLTLRVVSKTRGIMVESWGAKGVSIGSADV
ncbi:MAG: hypothetical protein PHN78_06370, partial [Dehalococcoidales bacterium]|nr:hypothetical protein [Dehalococcoidales bacterium]